MMQPPRQTNPFVQVLGFLVGFVFFVAAVLVGGIVLAAIVGTLLIAALIVYVRVWWLTRKSRERGRRESYVEAEYRIIEERDIEAPGKRGDDGRKS